jgi:uncharacterized protein YqiB (DUF1249 family)
VSLSRIERGVVTAGIPTLDIATGKIYVHIMHHQHSRLVIALSHYHQDRSGDLVPELDFTIAMYSTTQTTEVLMYEDCFGYRRVYSEDGMSVSPSTKKELNSFLEQWLNKLTTLGHLSDS